MVKAQFEPPRMIDEPQAKFAIAQHDPLSRQQGELRAHDIIGQGARTEQELHVAGVGEVAEHCLGALEIGFETVGAVRFRRLLKGPAHFPAHGHRAGEKIHRAGLKGFGRRRTEEFARRDLKGFQRDIHRLKLARPPCPPTDQTAQSRGADRASPAATCRK